MFALEDVVSTIRNDVVDFAKGCDDSVDIYVGNDVEESFPIYVTLSDFPSHLMIKAEDDPGKMGLYVQRMLEVLSEFHSNWDLDVWCADATNVIDVPSNITKVSISQGLHEAETLLSSRMESALLRDGRKDLFYYNRYNESNKLNRKLFVFVSPTFQEQAELVKSIGTLAAVGIHVIICGTKKLYGPLYSKIYASIDLADNSRGTLVMSGESVEFAY